MVRNVRVCYSSPGHTEELEKQLLHLQVRVLRHGNLTNVHRGNKAFTLLFIQVGLNLLRKSMTSNCLKVKNCSVVELADLRWFVPEGSPDMWLFLHLSEVH